MLLNVLVIIFIFKFFVKFERVIKTGIVGYYLNITHTNILYLYIETNNRIQNFNILWRDIINKKTKKRELMQKGKAM